MARHRVEEKTSEHGSLLLSIALLILAIPCVATAANHYVRAGATGANNGADWNNAFTNVPTTLVRGDTYYVADGAYDTELDLDDAASGNLVITIKKATIADHGTETGWLDSYGDGQAVWQGDPGWAIRTDDWVIDGAKRDSLTSGYGFKIDSAGSSQNLILNFTTAVDNVTVKYLEIEGTGRHTAVVDEGFHLTNGGTNITLSYVHVFNAWVPIKITDVDGLVLEYSMIRANSSEARAHSEAMSVANTDNLTVRYNHFRNIEGTGFIVALGQPATFSNWDIHGNVFYWQVGNPLGNSIGNGVIATLSGLTASNWKFHNNAIINISSSSARLHFTETPNNVKAYNNYWYKCAGLDHDLTGTNENDYNIYVASIGGAPTETNGVIEPADTDRFVDWVNGDFHLTEATPPGRSDLGAPFNVDPDGETRGADGTWDRGAFEFTGQVIARPDPPQNLRVVVR